MKQRKKILIVGGYGFIGKSIFKLLSQKYKVVRHSRRTGLDLTTSNFSVLDNEYYDTIINCAVHVGSIKYNLENAATLCSDNLLIYTHLYKLALRVKAKNVINLISNCAYPGFCNLQIEKDFWMGEPHESIRAFAISKRALIVLSEAYMKQHSLQSFNLILPGVYGVGDYDAPMKVHALDALIIRFIKAKRENTKVEIWGTGNPIREWIYVEDVARLVEEILNRSDLPLFLNAGQKFGISIKELADLIKHKINFNNEIVYLKEMEDGDPIKILDDTLFREYFPNFLFTTLEDGINSTIKYYEEIL